MDYLSNNFKGLSFKTVAYFSEKKDILERRGRSKAKGMAQKMTHTNIGLTLEGNQCSSLPFVILTCKRCVTEWSKCNLFKKCPNVALLFEV